MNRPDNTLDKNDPGDDTQRRFRYQATRTAMLALSLIDGEANTEEVFCEHHEDILVKKGNGLFIGEQVKTKLDKLGPFKAIDEEVVNSIRRFSTLERQYGEYFEGYVLATNAGFWDENKTTSSLPYLLAQVQSSKSKLPKKVADYLKKIFPKPRIKKYKVASSKEKGVGRNSRETADDCHSSDALQEWEKQIEISAAVLGKLQITILPSLRDMRAALIEMLPKFDVVGDRLYSELGTISDALIADVLKASALDPDYTVDRYLSVFNEPDQIMADAIIRGKRITRDQILAIIQQSLPRFHDLRTSENFSVGKLPNGMSVLEKKMAKGGLSIGNIGLAKDHKLSTEFMLTQWLHKHGKESTDSRYQHLRTIVRTDCQEAFDKAHTKNGVFGLDMLEGIRVRLRIRHQEERDTLGCRYEHLLGMAGILTEDCTLWWSEEFDLEEREHESV